MNGILVATLDLNAVRVTGESRPMGMRVWLPNRSAEGAWICRLELPGLDEGPIPIEGEDSMQAICLAISLAEQMFRHAVESGVKLEYRTGGEFPLEHYFGRISS